MKCRHATVAFLALALSAPAAVLASDIYKWTDENGVVHFGDRPSGNRATEIVHISSDRTDPAKVQARVQDRAAPAAAAEQAAGGPTEEQLQAQEKERAEKCALYKERLQKFLTSRYRRREDENGERVYLDEQQTLDARAKVQEQVVEYCNS